MKCSVGMILKPSYRVGSCVICEPEMGEEEEDLVFLRVSAELETWLGSRVMCGVAVPLAKKA